MDPWFKWATLCGLLFLSWACRNAKSTHPGSPIPAIHQFDSFYSQFHQDSIFQMSRILFPLEGKPEQLDTLPYLDAFFWPKESWTLHRLFNEQDTTYERIFQVVDSSLLKEFIFHKPSGYSMERRFSLMEGGWHLIYYSPMRRPIRIEIN